ncbi:MAG: DUF86 domain-containing protein [Bryobacteraceae bacterium]
MPSDAAAAALRDMEHHIALATQFVAGLDYEAFRNDICTVAVTRRLEIISEASRRLPDAMKNRHPAIAGKTWPALEASTATTTRTLPRSW